MCGGGEGHTGPGHPGAGLLHPSGRSMQPRHPREVRRVSSVWQCLTSAMLHLAKHILLVETAHHSR